MSKSWGLVRQFLCEQLRAMCCARSRDRYLGHPGLAGDFLVFEKKIETKLKGSGRADK